MLQSTCSSYELLYWDAATGKQVGGGWRAPGVLVIESRIWFTPVAFRSEGKVSRECTSLQSDTTVFWENEVA